MIRCFYPLSRLYSSFSRIFCKIRCRRWLTADCVMPYRRAGAAGAARENRKKTKRNLKTHLLRFPVLLGLLYDSANVSLFSCHFVTPKSASVASLAKLSFLSLLLPHTLLGRKSFSDFLPGRGITAAALFKMLVRLILSASLPCCTDRRFSFRLRSCTHGLSHNRSCLF